MISLEEFAKVTQEEIDELIKRKKLVWERNNISREKVISLLEEEGLPYEELPEFYIRFPMREDDPGKGMTFQDENGNFVTCTHKTLRYAEAYHYLTMVLNKTWN